MVSIALQTFLRFIESSHLDYIFCELNCSHALMVMRSRTFDSTRNVALNASFEMSWQKIRVNCFKVFKWVWCKIYSIKDLQRMSRILPLVKFGYKNKWRRSPSEIGLLQYVELLLITSKFNGEDYSSGVGLLEKIGGLECYNCVNRFTAIRDVTEW